MDVNTSLGLIEQVMGMDLDKELQSTTLAFIKLNSEILPSDMKITSYQHNGIELWCEQSLFGLFFHIIKIGYNKVEISSELYKGDDLLKEWEFYIGDTDIVEEAYAEYARELF